MFCGNCGKQLKDEADFCPACGNKIEKSYNNQNAEMPVAKNPIPKKTLIMWLSIGGGVLVLVIAIIIIISLVVKNNTESRLRDALEESWITEYGVVKNNFVNDSIYSVDDFHFNYSENNNNKNFKFYFTTTISNDNFTSEIEGYALANSDASIVDDFKVDHKNTIPNKGVDSFDDPNDDESGKKRAGTEIGGFT